MIVADIAKCTGCRRCEVDCAFFHSGKVSNRLARVKVMNLYETGIDGPVACVQCDERYCTFCPSKAIRIGSLGQIIVSPNLCTLCGTCERNCPIGAIEIFGEFVYVCDLCGGRPKCVEACTEGAIANVEEGNHPSLKGFMEDSKKMNPSQKRHAYIEKKGQDLRDKWRKLHA